MSALSGRRKLKRAARKKTISDTSNSDDDQTLDDDYLEKKLGFKLGYKNEPNFDDEVVDKSLLHTLKSFIPFTKAYYEFKAATTVLDNYDRIQSEKAKSLEIVLQVQQGNVFVKDVNVVM